MLLIAFNDNLARSTNEASMTNIKVFRETGGITQATLANKAGLAQSRVSEIERGGKRSGCNAQTAVKIVGALNSLGVSCTFDDLFPAKKA